jgi:hypothetical protein
VQATHSPQFAPWERGASDDSSLTGTMIGLTGRDLRKVWFCMFEVAQARRDRTLQEGVLPRVACPPCSTALPAGVLRRDSSPPSAKARCTLHHHASQRFRDPSWGITAGVSPVLPTVA